MKYLQVIAILGMIALGAFIGSLIPIGKGNAAIFGAIIGCVLYGLLDWSRKRWVSSREKNGFGHRSQEEIENAASLRSMQESLQKSVIEEHLRSNHKGSI